MAAIRAVNSLGRQDGTQDGTEDGTVILVLQNFHRFIQSAEIVQALAQQILAGKQNRTFVVVLSPVVSIPTELEKLFVVLEHELPDREQLAEIARGIGTEDGELPSDAELQTVLDAASGLSRFEAEGAFSLSSSVLQAFRSDSHSVVLTSIMASLLRSEVNSKQK